MCRCPASCFPWPFRLHPDKTFLLNPMNAQHARAHFVRCSWPTSCFHDAGGRKRVATGYGEIRTRQSPHGLALIALLYRSPLSFPTGTRPPRPRSGTSRSPQTKASASSTATLLSSSARACASRFPTPSRRLLPPHLQPPPPLPPRPLPRPPHRWHLHPLVSLLPPPPPLRRPQS